MTSTRPAESAGSKTVPMTTRVPEEVAASAASAKAAGAGTGAVDMVAAVTTDAGSAEGVASGRGRLAAGRPAAGRRRRRLVRRVDCPSDWFVGDADA